MQLGSDSAPDLVIMPGDGVYQAGGRLVTEGIAIRVHELGAYVRSLSGTGSIDYRLCLWGWGGSVGSPNKLLGRTALHTVGSAAAAPENLLKVTWPLEEPAEVGMFEDIMVGVAWETVPARQMMLGGYSGTGLRYRKDLADGAPWPVSMKDSVAVTDHDMVAWIEAYAPLSGAFVYRVGQWEQIDALLVRRDGAWDSAALMTRRAGAWRNAL